jgi:hypothetical protein
MLVAFCFILLPACNEAKTAYEEGVQAEKAHDYERALNKYLQAASYSKSTIVNQAKSKIDDLKKKLSSADEAIKKADNFTANRDYEGAIAIIKTALASLPDYPPLVEKLRALDEKMKAHRLGDGYKTAKWGMSKVQVKAALGGAVDKDSDDLLFININEKTIKCWFSKDRLWLVEFKPNLSDGDTQGAEALRKALVEKFGPGEETEGFSNLGYGQVPITAHKWEDDETTIVWRMYKPSEDLPRTASTTTVRYESKSLKKESENAKEDAAERQLRQRQGDFAGDL